MGKGVHGVPGFPRVKTHDFARPVGIVRSAALLHRRDHFTTRAEGVATDRVDP